MARVNRRARGRSRRDARGLILGIVLIALAVLCAAALAYFYFTIPRAPKLNKESFCPLDGPHAVTVLLIDASDDLPTITKREISTTLSDISEGIAPYGLLELRTLGAGDTTTRILFSKCNPGDGKGASEWTSAPEVLRRRWRNEFQKPLSEALESSLRPNKSTISPIMATIQGIAVDRFTSKSVRDVPKRLIVVSDMLEHSSEYSQYPPNDLTFERFRKTSAYLKTRTDLHGAEVHILYVQRLTSRPINTLAHMEFWARWVSDSKGHSKVSRLQGAGQ